MKFKTITTKQLFLAIVAILVCASTNSIQAQGYLRAGGGFGIGTTKDAFVVPKITKDTNNVTIKASTIFGSFGQGGRFTLAGGYMITPYFGVELELYYFIGMKQDYGSIISPNGDNYERTGYSTQFRTKPSLIVQAPTGKFQPYARFGVLIPLLGQTILEDSKYIAANGSTTKTQLNINGKFSVGFESSVGLRYNITDNLGIYVEATYTGLRIKSKDAEYTKDMTTDRNGITTDNLPNKLTITRFIEFQDEITLNSNHNSILNITGQVPDDVEILLDGRFDPNAPLNVLTQTSNFNGLTFNIGVRYTFNKKEKNKNEKK